MSLRMNHPFVCGFGWWKNASAWKALTQQAR
jgi:hypothetical protein